MQQLFYRRGAALLSAVHQLRSNFGTWEGQTKRQQSTCSSGKHSKQPINKTTGILGTQEHKEDMTMLSALSALHHTLLYRARLHLISMQTQTKPATNELSIFLS